MSVPVYEVAAKRFEVAGFESQGYLSFIVSDLDRKNNLQIAESLAPLVAGFLNSAKRMSRPGMAGSMKAVCSSGRALRKDVEIPGPLPFGRTID